MSKMRRNSMISGYLVLMLLSAAFLGFPVSSRAANSSDYQSVPPFVTAGVPPLVMLVMSRNHKLYYEAYNDASDLDGDGHLDVGYNPSIDYYGYFDSYKYYEYSSGDARFEPRGTAADKKAPDGNFWSGDFLNYLTMTRMDCMRKVLYGGYRSTDSPTETVLERSFVPQDAHSWGKEYRSISYDGYDIEDYTPLDQPKGGSRHLLANTTLSEGGDPLLRVLENSVYRIWEWVAIERPVAGAKALHGTTGPPIEDNNVSGGIVDVTSGGSAGTAYDSYAGAGGPGIIKTDDFSGASLDSDWQWIDADTDAGTDHFLDGGALVIKAAGVDVWTGSDEFAAVYMDDVSGDFDFKLRVTQQERQNGWGKTGIMVKNDLTQNDSATGYCMISVTPDNGFSFQWDSDDNGRLDRNTDVGSVTLPAWVRLTRSNNVFTGYYSTDGISWNQVDDRTINSANLVQDVGIFVTSHSAGNLSECRFSEMELSSYTAVPDPDLAFDDDANTRWNYPDEPTSADPVWIGFEFSSSVEIKSYSINAGSDAPDDWTFEGSGDGVSWDVLDSVTNAGLTPGTAETFDCGTSGSYRYYRLVMTDSANTGTDGVSIAEIQFMETLEPIPATATLTDYDVRIKVCDAAVGVEPNAKLYPSGMYKPVGILQRHGESDRMYFGLLTGSYTKNTSGGVLRKNVGTIRDEINASTGEFLYQDSASVDGIIKTIDSLRIVGFDYGSHSYNSNCGWITGGPLSEGECRMWGNPVAEMMYETLRYFSGAKSPTPEFTYGTTSNDDNDLGLPKPDWLDPYTDGEDTNMNGILDPGEDLNGNGILDGFDYCAKPFMLVLSDINPTYDSDQLPGSNTNFSGSVSDPLAGLNVETLADTISSAEGISGSHFMGQVAADNDGACSPKTLSGFGDIRGLCPEEPTKQGSYYAASVAYHGNIEDIHPTASESQNVSSYVVGLSSPLPQIEIPVGGSTITMVPFAKSVGGGYSISSTQGDFQPTNTIVDFFVEEISPSRGKFRINFEDVEQGADHDMDAIVEYIYQVVDSADNPVSNPALGEKVIITLNSTYAAGSIIQHMGYIISGTTSDGTYLEVRDYDTGAGSDPDYFLDTPPGVEPGGAWNDGAALPLTATRTFTPGTSGAATLLKNPLWYAAKWGGFQDYNANNVPDLDNEWDKDGDGVPDTYFYVQNPLRLEEQLNRSFADILRRTASGTAASVISQTRSGEGAVYQAVFYPEFKGPLGNTINWAGELHALFVDSYGNMREDTNGNAIMDPVDDLVIVFDGTTIYKYADTDGDDIIEEAQTPVYTGSIDDIAFIWSSSSILNEMSDGEIASQRIYNTATSNRYIFTFIDQNRNMVADTGEQMEFLSNTIPSAADLTDDSLIYPYLTLFPTFEDEPSIVFDGSAISMNTFRTGHPSEFVDFLANQSKRVIDYIRGIDQPEFISPVTPAYILPPFRSRQVDYDDDGTLETWRLGDIVYSTPTVVGRPAENYHMLYRDTSYAAFADKFRNRRNVVYAGANDGMFHAFNAGFYDETTKSFSTQLTTETSYNLGAELWAYVPFNLLPHLYWLTEPTYPHVYYNDLKPKVFDAKIFPNGTYDDGTDGEPDWGTLLVGGMRFGGGQIVADMDKTDGNVAAAGDPVMSSAYFILDITDPESEPTVLAEIRFEDLGYTTCYPAVIPMKDKDPVTGTIQENEWYLVFGSGPASAAGTADINGSSEALSGAASSQTAKLYVVDVKELVLNKNLKTLDDLGVFTEAPATVAGDHDYFQSLDADSFVSDPVSVDFDLDYNADVVYFGTVSGDKTTGWGGNLRRLVIDNNVLPSAWDGDSLFFSTDPGQPIVTAPSVGLDDRGNRWIFFGTGRFFVRDDSGHTDTQTYYGIKEPFADTDGNGFWDPGETPTWGTVLQLNLVDTSNAVIFDNKSITGVDDLAGVTVPAWDVLINEMNLTSTHGWSFDFSTFKERNLGQATLFGDLLTFTTYVPSSDICSFEGESNLYAVYYKTGTAYFSSVIGSTFSDLNGNSEVDPEQGELQIHRNISLGKGLATTPNIHVGKQDGSKAFVQTSTGAIEVIEQANPATVKSGVISWEEME